MCGCPAQRYFPLTVSGDDGRSVTSKCTTAESDGMMHAWAKFSWNGKPVVLHASLPIADIEAEIVRRLPKQTVAGAEVDPDGEYEYVWVDGDEDEEDDEDEGPEVGDDGILVAGRRSRRRRRRRARRARRARRRKRLKRFGKKFARGVKRVARKVAKSKLVKGISNTMKKVLNNPIVTAALAAVPGGQAVLAARTAARLARRAAKGIRGSRRAVRRIRYAASSGVPEAQAAMRLMAAGIALDMPDVASQLSVGIGADEEAEWDAIAGWDDVTMASGYDLVPWSTSGNDAQELARELEALEEFASAGAWEGARWLANRLKWQKMQPGRFSRLDAVLDGRNAIAQRFNLSA